MAKRITVAGPKPFRWAGPLALAAASAAAAVFACGDDSEPRHEPRPIASLRCDREGVAPCSKGGECAAGLACSAGSCLPKCEDAAACEQALDCGELGCECEQGICEYRVCSADEDCAEGRLCWAGSCSEPPSLEEVASCALEPRFGVSREGSEAQPLSLQLYDEEGAPIPLLAGPIGASALGRGLRLESSDPDRGAPTASGALLGGAEAGSYRITAVVGEVRCSSELINYVAVEEGELRVVAVDELSGLPVEGATVVIAEGGTSAITGADGAAIFDAAALGDSELKDVSVFHQEYMYLTLIDAKGEDLLLPLRRSIEAGGAGGVQGSFDPEAFDPALLNAGLVGMSLPGNLVDLSFSLLLGPVENIRVELGSAREVDVPRGLVLGLGNTWFKQRYRVVGMAGVCEDEGAVREGSCGTWSVWGLAGGMPLEELPLDELTARGSRMDVGQLLAHLLPQVKSFKSAVVRDVTISKGASPDDLDQLDLEPGLRLGLHPTLSIPPLPQVEGGSLDGVIAMGGALSRARGFVPLGITAGVDSGVTGGGDPSFEVVQPGGREGELYLRLAPLHGGLEGGRYALIAVAANLSRLMEDGAACEREDRSDCVALTAVMRVQDRVEVGAPVDLRGDGFVGFAHEVELDRRARRFSQPGEVEGDPTLMRLSFGGPGRRWTIYYPADTGSFEIPAAPTGFEDRIAGARASLQAMRVGEVEAHELWGYGPRGVRALTEFMTGFSSVDLPAPPAAD